MKIQIARINDVIAASVDLRDLKDTGELSHIICELERIKQELLAKWNSMVKGE